MVIDKNGTKWMATNRDGVVILAIIRSKKLCTDKGNLPASDVRLWL
jgi:hypothetical protein